MLGTIGIDSNNKRYCSILNSISIPLPCLRAEISMTFYLTDNTTDKIYDQYSATFEMTNSDSCSINRFAAEDKISWQCDVESTNEKITIVPSIILPANKDTTFYPNGKIYSKFCAIIKVLEKDENKK